MCPLLWPSAPLAILVIIDPCHFGFASDFEHFLHPFCRALVIKADPTLKLVFDCKFSTTEGTIPTWELRKWLCLPSCRWNQEVVQWSFFVFRWTSLSSKISGLDFLKGEGCNTLVYCSSYSISTSDSTVLIECLLQYKPNSRKMYVLFLKIGIFEVNWKVWIYKLLCIMDH
jgi:hypothetical protein